MKTLEISHLSSLISSYDIFILDVFGVVHDGEALYPHIIEVLEHLREAQKMVCFLTNAPQKSPYIIQKLERLGISKAFYQRILTAGDQTYYFLKERPTPWHARLGTICYFIGDHTMEEVLPTFGYSRAREIQEADFILMAGPDEWRKDLRDYEEMLQAGLEQGLPMVCGNPDLFVFRGPQKDLRAGLIAQRYQEKGGEVFYHGKPYPPTYKLLLESLKEFSPNRMLIIGDSILTDIPGAKKASLKCLLTVSRTTLAELKLDSSHPSALTFEKLKASLPNPDFHPTYFCPILKW